MAYGLTVSGFDVKPLEVIEDSIRTKQRATIDAGLNNSAGAAIGQMNGIVAEEIYEGWEVLQAVALARDPRGASGVALDNIGQVRGTPRDGLRKSTAVITCDLDASTALLASTTFVQHATDPNITFQLIEDFTAGAAGDYDLEFECTVDGPVVANSGTLTVHDVNVTGWNSATNAADATLGANVEIDTAFRARSDQEMQGLGAEATVDAIRSALIGLDSVTSATVEENKLDRVVNGLAPHSIRATVLPAVAPVPDDTIAQTIWDSQAGGIETNGLQSGTAIDDSGDSHTVYFDLATEVDIYVEADVDVRAADYPTDGDTQMKTAIENHGNALGPGVDVVWSKLFPIIVAIPGVADLTALRVDKVTPAVLTSNVSILPSQISRFATVRITVNSTQV